MMQCIDGSIDTGRRPEAASCLFPIKRDTTPLDELRLLVVVDNKPPAA